MEIGELRSFHSIAVTVSAIVRTWAGFAMVAFDFCYSV